MSTLPQTDMPEPPPPLMPPAPARQPGKLRTYLILGVIVAFLAFVLWSVKDNLGAGDLAVGTCFDRPAETEDFETVTRHECTESHDAEVIYVEEYTDSQTYPISLTLSRFLDEKCVPAVIRYTGKAAETLGDYQVGLFSPNLDTWNNGERTFTCYVLRADEGKITQSLRAAAS